ncbi:MAG TPA: hypothetical protein VF773_16305 [Verrucomicrobiae bacterium]
MSLAVKARGAKAKSDNRAVAKKPRRGMGFPGARSQVAKEQTDESKLAKLRADLGWSRAELGRVMNASDRAIVNWESGELMSAVYGAKLREIQSVFNELKQLMKPAEIGGWLLSDMEEFEGQTPADLIRRGETGRLWESLFYLRSGMPD